jgi:hypothetical protein
LNKHCPELNIYQYIRQDKAQSLATSRRNHSLSECEVYEVLPRSWNRWSETWSVAHFEGASQDIEEISKPDWERKAGFLRWVPTLGYFTISSASEAENTSSFLAKPSDI